MAHVTLVRPPLLVPKNTLQGPITPPIGLAYLASTLERGGHQVVIVDAVGEAPFQVVPLFEGSVLGTGLSVPEIVERIPPETDFIGVSAMFSGEWPYVKEVIRGIRQAFPETPLVGGGEHFTAVPEFSLEDCPEIDLCVTGEGEETLLELVNTLGQWDKLEDVAGIAYRKDGQPVRNFARKRIRELDDIPLPNWELVPLENYLSNGLGYGVNRGRSIPLLATRGCPYQCTFCSNPAMWTTRWLARDPQLVLDEIEFYVRRYSVTNVDFYDLTAVVKKQWIVDFCQGLLDRGLNITWQLPSGTRTEAIDEEVTRLLFQSGCRNLTYAPESGAPTTLKRIKKKIKLDRMLDSMAAAVRSGMNLKTNIIIGFPDETAKEVWQTIHFLTKMAWVGVHDVSISMFSPYPGSELFDMLRDRGQLQAMDDEYFLSLAAYTDLTESSAWSAELSSRQLSLFRLLGLAVFYGLQYLFRPLRAVQTLLNLFTGHQESRLDKSLQDFLRRSKAKKE